MEPIKIELGFRKEDYDLLVEIADNSKKIVELEKRNFELLSKVSFKGFKVCTDNGEVKTELTPAPASEI